MSLNWKEIDRILEELDLPGCRVQEVHEPDYRTLVLELYRPQEPFSVLISLAPQATRLHRMTGRVRKRRPIPRFAEFLRPRIRGCRIVRASQLGQERIIRVDLRRAEEETILWIRLWGGAANIIVTDRDGAILDAFFRRPSRGEISGGHFDPEAEISRSAAGGRSSGKEYSIRRLAGDGDFNSRIEAEYRTKEHEAELARLRERLKRYYEDRGERIRATIDRLKQRATEYAMGEQQKLFGDLIMMNLHRIRKGDRWLVAEDYQNENREVRIQIDPALSSTANAEAYYERYKKAHSGLQVVQEELLHLEQTLSTIEEESQGVLSSNDLQLMREHAREATQSVPRRGANQVDTPGLEFRSGSYRILVGRSATENDYLLRHVARGNDLWLHVRDYPGAYVFIRHIPGKSIPLDTLLDAGNLAVFYSKARSSGYAELYYTNVKHLRRPREGKKGLVLPTQEKNLSVRLESERVDRLQTGRS